MEANGKSCNGGSLVLSDHAKEKETLNIGLLQDLDSYWEDINGQTRLTISRMVSDSVIKDMANAVTQEGGDKIAQKELEVAELRERLNPYQMGMDGNESSGSKVVQNELNSTEIGVSCCYADALEGQDKLVESLGSLINVTKEQFMKLEKEIGKIRDCGTSKRINLDSLELDTVLLEKVPKNWVDVDETLGSLRTTLDIVYKKVDAVVYLSKISSNERQLKGDLREEIEDTVIKKSLQSAQEDIEVLGDKQASLYSNGSANWKEKIKEISNLRQELDAISKSFSVPETGQLSSHGSLEFGEDWKNSKWTDNFHRGVLGNRISPSVSLWEGNGKLEESIIAPENWDAANLKHMSREEMVNCFKMEMTKMKRNFECREELITDKYFSLRREYFKVQGSSLPLRKDKEFDMLRKKIPEVILKLDILVESEKTPTLSKVADSLVGLKERFDTLVFENHQLKDLLRGKNRELKSLSLQVSDAEEKLSENLLAEEKWVKLMGDLKCEIEDMHVQASICEEIYECLLREVTGIMGSIAEDSEMEFHIVQEIYNVIYTQAAKFFDYAYKNEIEDSFMESSIMQGLLEVVFMDVFKEANEKLKLSELRYSEERKIRLLLEMQTLVTEKAMRLEIAEKERLKHEILLQTALLEEKEDLVLEAEARLSKESGQFELASQELINLREIANQQCIVTLEGHKVSDILKGDLVKALEQIESQKTEICNLNQKLEQIDEERKMFHGVVHEKENALSLIEVKEREHNKQVESIIALEQEFSKLVTDFECRVTGAIKKNSLRFENLNSQFNDVIRKAVLSRRTDLMFKQKLERRCSDLQKAESEVDLLADEVDVLLSLLEKIYIALDHYSSVLKHYPGIMEILKLVRKELSGGPARFKASSSNQSESAVFC